MEWTQSALIRVLLKGYEPTLSYKVHKVIERPKEEYQVIPDTQEAIISKNIWLRVQELRKSKRRNTATGSCSIHYIREIVLETIIKDAVSELADFVRCYEPVFLYLQAQKHRDFEKNQVKKLKTTIEAVRKENGVTPFSEVTPYFLKYFPISP